MKRNSNYCSKVHRNTNGKKDGISNYITREHFSKFWHKDKSIDMLDILLRTLLYLHIYKYTLTKEQPVSKNRIEDFSALLSVLNFSSFAIFCRTLFVSFFQIALP